jgi:radical SAM protein with 4Fe4S-binding SPASM domain
MWNGDLTTCCHDTHGQNTRGNVLESGSFTKVWYSPMYQQLRKQVNSDMRKADPLCSVCPARVFVEDEDNW